MLEAGHRLSYAATHNSSLVAELHSKQQRHSNITAAAAAAYHFSTAYSSPRYTAAADGWILVLVRYTPTSMT